MGEILRGDGVVFVGFRETTNKQWLNGFTKKLPNRSFREGNQKMMGWKMELWFQLGGGFKYFYFHPYLGK